MHTPRNAFSIVSEHARTHPDAPALSGMGYTWTYRELAEQAERLAGAIASTHAPTQGVRIAVVANNHPLTCLVYLAAARAGMVVSLVNALFRAQELAGVFAKLAPHIVIFDAAHRTVVEAALEQTPIDVLRATLERDAALPSVEQWLEHARWEGALPQDHERFEISWTSGTTSSPKGAILTHDTAIFRAECEVDLFRLTAADTGAVITPLFHQSGIRDTVLVMWVCGGHAVVLPRFNLETFWLEMVKHGVTYLCMVETILLMLDRHPPCAEETRNVIRAVLAAGDPAVIRRCERRFEFRVVQVWGMTEVGVACAVPQSVTMDTVNALRSWARGAFLAGWPVSKDTDVRLVINGKVVSGEGVTGEIQMTSRLLFAGYYGDPDATASAFDGVWFKTGDLAMAGPDGALYFVDRLKDVIRRGGENVASKQVEEVLLSHPRVRAAAVVPVPDPLFIQEIKAVIVADENLDIEALWSWCDERLARYKVPRYIEVRDSLPVNGSGRVQKQVLLAPTANTNQRLFDRRALKITT